MVDEEAKRLREKVRARLAEAQPVKLVSNVVSLNPPFKPTETLNLQIIPRKHCETTTWQSKCEYMSVNFA